MVEHFVLDSDLVFGLEAGRSMASKGHRIWSGHFSESGDRLIDLLDGNGVHLHFQFGHLDDLTVLVSGNNSDDSGPITFQVVSMVLKDRDKKI